MRIVDTNTGGGPVLQQAKWSVINKLAIVAMIVIAIVAWTQGFGSEPELAPDVPHQFSGMYRATTATEGNIMLDQFVFEVDPATRFRVMISNPCPRELTVEDISLPANTFMYEHKTCPAVISSDGRVHRTAYNYILTRYHHARPQ